MAGRAGRAGATSSGEVFVCCSQRDSPHCELVMKGLERRGEMRLTSNISIKNPNNKASNDVLCRSSPLLRFFLVIALNFYHKFERSLLFVSGSYHLVDKYLLCYERRVHFIFIHRKTILLSS